ncbi:MAG: hypothetical protein ACI8ZB_004284 [Desulforhopalus sp.]|jgi:hypothetical protein
MALLIIIFGTLTFWTGSVIVLNPERICGFLHKYEGRVLLHFLNVFLRLGFAFLLLSQSSQSKFSLLTDIIGGFCIAIALILTFMGRARFKRSISWAITLVETNNHIAGFLVMIFGVFLVYAFL